MRGLTRGSYKILSRSFSMLIPDGGFDGAADGCVSAAAHMGGSIRAVTRCLHQRKLAKLCVLLFSKTDCATGAQLRRLLKWFLANLSTTSNLNSTHFSKQFDYQNGLKVKGLFAPRTVNYKDTNMAFTPADDIILFIISFAVCSSSLKQDGFWLAVNVFMVHQLTLL